MMAVIHLLVAVSLSGFMGVNVESCDYQGMIQCTRMFAQYQQQAAAGMIRFVDEEHIENVCSTYIEVKNCVRAAVGGCPTLVTLVWQGAENAFKYLCSPKGKIALLSHQDCYHHADVLAGASSCNRTFHTSITRHRAMVGGSRSVGDYFADFCSDLNHFLWCNHGTAERECSSDAASWQVMLMTKFLQPSASFIRCTLATGSDVAGENNA